MMARSSLLPLLLPLLLLLLLAAVQASTSPKWYQRSPKPPTNDNDEKKKKKKDSKQDIVVPTKPYWLQRVTNSTTPEEKPKKKRWGSRTKKTERSEDAINEKEQGNRKKKSKKESAATKGASKEGKDPPSDAQKDPKEPAKKEEEEKGGWGPFRRGGKDDTAPSESKEPEKEDTPKADTIPAKKDDDEKKKGRGRKKKKGKQDEDATPEDTAEPSKAEEAPESAPPDVLQPQEQVPQQNQPQQQQQPQQQRVIVLGGQPQQSYFNRQQQQQQQQLPFQQFGDQNSAALAEALSYITSTVTRVLLLTWVTRRLANQEESMMSAKQHFVWERWNDKFSRDSRALDSALSLPPLGVRPLAWKLHLKKALERRKRVQKNLNKVFERTVVVVELSDQEQKSGFDLAYLADVVSFLLQQQRRKAFGVSKATGKAVELEVVFLINSPGGSVSTFGLAAAQLQRLRGEPHITTTACVDKYAASGGYMMASQTDYLVAAPFATVGSVGVIMEGLNFHEIAKRYGVQPMVIKAGESKNPLTTWGPVSRQDLDQEKYRLEKVHEEFKELIYSGRPNVMGALDGSVYLGREAKALGLIDEIMTTDEYLMQRVEAGDRVLKLHRSHQHRFPHRPMLLSPYDILPHLKSWITTGMQKAASGDQDYMAKLVKAGTWMGFLHHLFRTYGPK